jgi:outer membrane protein OmpA-like peptidoglycan-associated protein
MKKLVSFLALVSLIFSGLVATALPASATAADNDATLSSVTLGNEAFLNTAFAPNVVNYDVFATRASADWNIQAANSSAAIRVTGPTGAVTDSTGTATLSLTYAPTTGQSTTIRVTSADSTKTVTYRFNVSSKVMPQVELVNISDTRMANTGSTYLSATLSHAFIDEPTGHCYTNAYYEYKNFNGEDAQQYVGRQSSKVLDDGSVLVLYHMYDTYQKFNYTGKANLVFYNACNGTDEASRGVNGLSINRIKDALTIFEPSVTSNDIPNQITFQDVFDLKGPGISSDGQINVYVQDVATGERFYVNNRWFMGEDWARFRLGGHWNTDVWSTQRPVDVIVEHYDYGYGHDPIIMLKKRVTFVPFVPKNVLVSPAKGPIVGGNYIKLRGQNLCNNYREDVAHLFIGGQEASWDWGSVSCTWGGGSSDGYHIDGVDTVIYRVPAGTQAGQVTMAVNSGFGLVTLATKYTYGAKPTLTSVAPAAVANTGGSIVTLIGTGFGNSGTPTVTMDGIKAPWVQRLSATKIVAMVPENIGKTGDVDLNIISSSGGGALDAPGTITLVAATSNPVVTSVSPDSAGLAGGDTITIKGTGFTVGSTGVYIGDYPAAVISSTATEIQVELPSGDTAGTFAVSVGTPTGFATKASAFSYLATPGVTGISPSTVATTTPAANAKVTITGIGFGTTGTIKVGSKAAIAYTATGNGTIIANVAIPNTVAAQVPVVITPKGSARAFNGMVVVTGPKLTNFGLDSDWRWAGIISSSTYARAVSSPEGGKVYRLDGTGFGTSGKVKVGTTLVTPTTYTDTAITFVMPAKAAGIYDITVVPSIGSAVAVAPRALGVNDAPDTMTISKIESAVNNTRGAERFTFDPQVDASDLFVISGTKLNGTDASKTRVYIWGEFGEPITPVSTTATTITFHAPRNLDPVNWYPVIVKTNVDKISQNSGIFYVGNVPAQNVVRPAMTPAKGLCLKTATAGRTPAVLTATGVGLYGTSGTVSFAGVDLPAAAVTWSADSVTVNLANQTTDLNKPWGSKAVVFTPTDTSLIPSTFSFNCAVDSTVTTTLGGSTTSLSINAGSNYTAGASFTNPMPNAAFTPAADGYVWQTAEDFQLGAWSRNVHFGLPIAAGDYYVRANISAGTYDREMYSYVTNANEVHLTINGSPIAFTPKLRGSTANSITYKGQLGDGTNGSSNDIMYTNTTAANSVTAVTWQYRNHACAVANPAWGWTAGLPRDVAIEEAGCGGDGTTVTSWEIRVASFEMLSGGVDRSVYYVPTFNTFLLTINKRSVTATGVKVEKQYDANNTATLGELTLTNGVEGDAVTLNPLSSIGATYSDANAGNGKTITLTNPLVLSDGWARNYVLTNSNLAITGKILKADAKIKLTPSVSSIVISNTQTVNVSVETTDYRTGQTPDVLALIADPVITSKTPGKCTYAAGVVTAVSPGDCIIEARQPASTNYNSSIAWHDDASTVESITIKIYPAPKNLSVVADDITVAFGDGYSPSAIVTGLLDGDALDGFTFEYYQGNTLLNSPPTAVGTYRIVASGGTLTAADSLTYSNVFKYVAGKLVITPAPPTLSAISPNHGPEAGGNTVVITGTGLENVTSVIIGGITLRKPKFVVNGTGTEITFKAPAGVGVVDLTLRAGTASVSGQYIYDEPPVVTSEFGINIEVLPSVGKRLAGQKVQITGGGLKANSAYSLYIGTGKVSLFKGVTDSNGNFDQLVTLPAKACVSAGKQVLTLTGKKTDDTDATDSAQLVLDANCTVAAVAEKTETKQWTVSGFLFNYLKFDLTDGGVKSLTSLVPLIKNAKTITIYGYTQTDATSDATKKANLTLALNRSKTVMDFLKAKGIKAVYKTYGMGGVDPVSTTDQSKNRRVVIEVNY